MGNSRARAVYEAMLPDGFRRPQTDSSLESFIRAKYEHKKYLAREWVPPPPPKVDWDREIDEEIERQKRKKKSSSSAVGSVGTGAGLSLSSPLGSGGSAAANKKSSATSNSSSSATGASSSSSSSSSVPKLKAPASSLKSSSRNSTSSATEAGTGQAASGTTTLNTSGNSSAGADLLGLSLNESTGGGGNSSSISGTSTANGSANNGIDLLERKSNATDDLAKAEADFFNQSASGAGIGGDAGSSKLTKDKIMALYGSGPAPTMAGAGAFGGGGFGGFQQATAPATVATGGLGPAGSTFPSAVNMQPFNNGQPTNAFGAFQTFPTSAAIGGASGMMNGNQPPLAGGQYVMPHGQPMMYGTNGMANGGGAIPPVYHPTVIGPLTMVPPQYPGMMAPAYAANHLLQQQQPPQHQQSVMGFPPMAGTGAAGLGGVPAFATFPNSVPQQQHQQQQLQPTASDKLNNQFGTMNLRDVWQ